MDPCLAMVTSSNGNIFRVTSALWWDSTGHQWIHKGQWREVFMFSLVCAWSIVSANNRDTGDKRRHRTHYDVIVWRHQTITWTTVGYKTLQKGIQRSKGYLLKILDIKCQNRLVLICPGFHAKPDLWYQSTFDMNHMDAKMKWWLV